MYYGLEIEFLIYAVILGFIVSLIILIVDRIKKRDISALFKHITTALLIIYLLFLLTVTIFLRSRNLEVSIGFELIPLKNLINIFRNKTYRELYEVAANILVFVPYGFLLSCVIRKRKYLPLICGLATTVSIEIVQYVDKRGVFDINDIINNFIGVLIGYGVYRLFRSICQKAAERKDQDEFLFEK